MKYSGIDLLGSSPGGPKPSKMSILPNSLLFFTIWKTIFGVRCIQNDDTVPTCILGTPTHLQWSIIASFKVNLNKNTEKRCCGVFFFAIITSGWWGLAFVFLMEFNGNLKEFNGLVVLIERQL